MVDLFKRFFEQIELHVEINAFGSGRSRQIGLKGGIGTLAARNERGLRGRGGIAMFHR